MLIRWWNMRVRRRILKEQAMLWAERGNWWAEQAEQQEDAKEFAKCVMKSRDAFSTAYNLKEF